MTRIAILAIALIAVCTPRGAEAQSRYFWKNVNNGVWNNANNWEDMDDPQNKSFPNGPGDEAHFTLAYTQPHTVNIPAAGVTVGAIYFDSHAITINSPAGGKLRLQTATPPGAVILRLNPAPAARIDVFNAPIELRVDMFVTVTALESQMQFNGAISGPNGLLGITKLGAGRLDLQATNTYLGRTAVEQGQLRLLNAPSSSVRGSSLTIGPVEPPRGGGVAEVFVQSSDQIADTTPVEVRAGGRLTINSPEQVGATTVTRGEIFVADTSQSEGLFTVASLTMTGGLIDSQEGGSLTLLGNVTVLPGPGAVIRRTSGPGTLILGSQTRTFNVAPGTGLIDLAIRLPIVASTASGAGLVKIGEGVMSLEQATSYDGPTQVYQGELRVAVGANDTNALKEVFVGSEAPSALLTLLSNEVIHDTAPVRVGTNGTLDIRSPAGETFGALTINKGRVRIGPEGGTAGLQAVSLSMRGGRIEMSDAARLSVTNTLDLSSIAPVAQTAVISGGRLLLTGTRTLFVQDGGAEPDATITSIIPGNATQGVTKTGLGTLTLTGDNTYGGATTITSGRLNINGKQPASPVVVGGILAGKGVTGPVSVGNGGTVLPGDEFGRLATASIIYAAGSTHQLRLEGSGKGQYGQLAVTGTVTLGNAKFTAGTKGTLSPEASYRIIENDGNDPVADTFDGLKEGADVLMGGVTYTITYRGGDGNDVVIKGSKEEEPPLPTYYLAEGATGSFFDDDVLIANPNDTDVAVKLTFLTERSSSAPSSELAAPSATARAMPLREGGETVVVDRVIPANSRVTIHVDQLEGLENVSASVKVESIDRLPLVVERTMFWDASYYGGHTANAVSQPEKRWIFAEGFDGFYDTYILIANANATKTTVTLTFLRENETPVVKTVEVAPFARQTIRAGVFEELKNRAFGIIVDATEPVIAERSMYFVSRPGKTWSGGHVNTGTAAPSRSWFHAEGATGNYFNTFILLSNPQDTEAKAEVRFLLTTGDVISRTKTLAPKQRMTINPMFEDDPRLRDAALSTVVESDVPIVSERSMYWSGDEANFGEGHNSSGLTETGLHWGLAEGRIGGDREFLTYILLANPSTKTATVRVTYLRESGAPIVKVYDVPATSRFNIDVKADVPELQNSSFGANIEVLNDAPIAVERSLYWNANGALWAGGTNALATRLPPIE